MHSICLFTIYGLDVTQGFWYRPDLFRRHFFTFWIQITEEFSKFFFFFCFNFNYACIVQYSGDANGRLTRFDLLIWLPFPRLSLVFIVYYCYFFLSFVSFSHCECMCVCVVVFFCYYLICDCWMKMIALQRSHIIVQFFWDENAFVLS